MIRLTDNEGDLVLILEPGNVTKLMQGEALEADCGARKVRIYWTPDIMRLALDLGCEKESAKCITSERLHEMIQKSLDNRVLDRVAS